MTQQSTEKESDRILVALDASSHSVAALRAAAELAVLLDVELEGVFVEDINLLYLCGFPFGQEVGSYTAGARRLDTRAMKRQLRVLALVIREEMERVAGQVPVRWTFEVRRGSVVAELLAASRTASMLGLGRASRSQRKTLGSTVQSVLSQASRPVLILGEDGGLEYPLIVLYTGTAQADRALRLALRLSKRNDSALNVLVWAGEGEPVSTNALRAQVEDIVTGRDLIVQLSTLETPEDVLHAIGRTAGGTLVLPGERSVLLVEHSGPTIIVP